MTKKSFLNEGERLVVINDKTSIITKSKKSDEELRKAYLEKLAFSKQAILGGNSFHKSSFGNYDT